jgi:flavin reductase (DIM6/NTAB) family NADH-FMN oxidoreductase RutF
VSATIAREDFFAIMAAHASGVAIVTTVDAAGEPRGLTTTAFASASVDPPLVTVCVDRTSRTLPALLHTRRFVVSLMKSGHDAACAVFAAKGEDKFSRVNWAATPSGLPVLEESATAWIECKLERDLEVGDHILLVGRAEHGRPPDDACEPLLYFRRRYGRFDALAAS